MTRPARTATLALATSSTPRPGPGGAAVDHLRLTVKVSSVVAVNVGAVAFASLSRPEHRAVTVVCACIAAAAVLLAWVAHSKIRTAEARTSQDNTSDQDGSTPVNAPPTELAGSAWAWRHKRKPYFKAFGVFFAMAFGVSGDSLSTYLPMLYLGLALSVAAAPFISAFADVAARFDLRRGFADVAIGVAVTGFFWAPGVLGMLSKGSEGFLAVAGTMFAGACAGATFWFADGCPLGKIGKAEEQSS